MNLWHDIKPSRMHPEDFLAVIEIEKGSKNKYEMDKETGALRLDRILYTSTHYPANYGFIPRTYADDGDPLDVLVLCSEPIRPLSLVRVYPVGYFTMRDGGKLDDSTCPTRSATSSACTSTWSRTRTRRWTASTAGRRPWRLSSGPLTNILKPSAGEGTRPLRGQPLRRGRVPPAF